MSKWDEVKLQITVRSTKDKVRKHLLDGIKRIAEGCAKAANAPAPVVKVQTWLPAPGATAALPASPLPATSVAALVTVAV